LFFPLDTSALVTNYKLRDNEVSGFEDDIYLSVRETCINGYEWSINGVYQAFVTGPSITLHCSLTALENCSDNVLTIRPRVMVGNTVLSRVIVNGTTCPRGELHCWTC